MCVHGCIVGEPWSQLFTCGETEIGDRRILQTSLEERMKYKMRPGDVEGYGHLPIRCQKLAMMLLGFMAKALKLEKGEMEELFEDGMQSVRMTYYPPCPQPELVMGLTPHSDATGITILLQINGVDGLQIKKDGVWIPVSFLPDALVVNVGDVLEAPRFMVLCTSGAVTLRLQAMARILSNGVYTSIEHRATVNAAKERISLPCSSIPNSHLRLNLHPA
ncbi:Protein SRG1 [Vitis vinifera]|uniref:Protein SRG1 n=1 Tax=Vitis vinifera TaxID=29760 RepID=A0A438GGD3_VITVI|nr:Protein SRG1 [Vitis vinifera]